MSSELYETVSKLIKLKKFTNLRKIILDMNTVDIAELIDRATPSEAIIIFRLLPKEDAAEVFSYMDSETCHQLIKVFTDHELHSIIDELYIDDVTDLLEEIPANVVRRILKAVSPEDRKTINQILNFPENSAGSLITTEFVSLKAKMTVSEAFNYIRKHGPDKETIYTCYVTDNCRKLLGTVSVKELLLSDETKTIGEIMETNVISVFANEHREVAAEAIQKYDLTVLPVVDTESRLIGIITVDDILDVIEEEATEDIEKMAAISPADKPYLKMKVFDIFKNRIPWLLVLMLSSTFTGMIITSFESALASSLILTSFIPMIMSSGGNSGSQSSVTIIRSLALGDVTFKDTLKVMFKEFRVSLFCGFSLGLVNFIKMFLIDSFLYGESITVYVALVVSLTLFFTVILAKIIGSALPLLAKKIGFDPAVMASPFITTIVDAISLLIYFEIATIILKI